jgi:hypothetical protein
MYNLAEILAQFELSFFIFKIELRITRELRTSEKSIKSAPKKSIGSFFLSSSNSTFS